MKISSLNVISWELYDNTKVDENTHNILIPIDILDQFYKYIDNNEPMYLEITSPLSTNPKFRCLVFSNIHNTYGNEQVVVLPKWSMDKLGISDFSPICIENIKTLRKANYIKLKANNSTYTQWDDIKELLEEKLIACKCISLEDKVSILGVEFMVIEIRDSDKIKMIDCSLFETDVSIEFETPDDLVELEKLRIERHRLQAIEIENQKKQIELAKLQMENEERERLERLSKPIDKNKIANMYDKLFSEKNPSL